MIQLRGNLSYIAAFISALAFLWSGIKLYKSKIIAKIDISVYMLFFIAQILWLVDALMDNDYLLLSAYTINIIIYFYIFYYYHNKCHAKPGKMG